MGSAQWRSSKTTTSGDSWARHSKNLRAAQKVSSGVDAAAETPSAAAMLRAIPLPSASPGRRSAILACASSAESASWMPAACLTTSASGQKVMPSP